MGCRGSSEEGTEDDVRTPAGKTEGFPLNCRAELFDAPAQFELMQSGGDRATGGRRPEGTQSTKTAGEVSRRGARKQ